MLAVDVDPILTSSFHINHPRTQLVLADISALNGNDIRRELDNEIDGLFGGPPCQAFSSIGQRNPLDPRRTLLGHFFRLVRELAPKFFVMENVKGLGYSDSRPILDEAMATLPTKYNVVGPLLLDAADFGAATSRTRLFVIGYDRTYVDQITEPNLASYKRRPATVRQAIADLIRVRALPDADGFDQWKIARVGKPSLYASRLRSSDGTFTGHLPTAHTKDVIARFRKVKPGTTDIVGRHPRLHWDRQCPTLRAGTGNDRGSFQSVRPIHPSEPRVITVREGARLQGFPDDFRFHPTIWHSFRMIGNSVSPIIAEAIFSMIKSKIELPSELLAAE